MVMEALDKSGQKTQTFNYKISAEDVKGTA